MKAFILCAGVGSRLRPLTFHFPKASIPFLNLPLFYYNWFYLEKMGLKHAILNSHLFPETLKETVHKAKNSKQKVSFSFEPQSLGSAGGLFSLKSHFIEDNSFLYLNGDSLFFPSEKAGLSDFLVHGEKAPLGCFWAAPFAPSQSISRALWIDKDSILRAIGGIDQVHQAGFKAKYSKDLTNGELRPVQFSGLALFKKEIFKFLSPKTNHIFHNVTIPLISKGAFKVFPDEKGVIFEGGEIPELLNATKHCLDSLFSKRSPFIRNWLLEIFQRFDPTDETVGLKRGEQLGKEKKALVLCPKSVNGLSRLQVKNFAVLGKGVCLKGNSILTSSIIGEHISWRGAVENQMLLKFYFEML
ncbi:MAG: NDP-sugar synthase [Bdellovibrionales bacterium]|nr:NDP-sugar synthase [Bdellovibrionales bacterium]